MGEINVDDLKPGMVLASDLKDSKGRKILSQGSAIETKHIEIMKSLEITAADIKGLEQKTNAERAFKNFDKKILQTARAYVESLFSNSIQDHDALWELKRLCILRTYKSLSQGKPIPGNEMDEDVAIMGGEGVAQEKLFSVNKLVEKSVKLSTIPNIYRRIVNIVNDKENVKDNLADVVSKDYALSATLLKHVNSSFYGLPNPVGSIEHAINMIGNRRLSTLAMAIPVISCFKGISPQMVDMEDFWIHSITCGIIARSLAHYKNESQEEQFFLGGLLHDIGRLVIFKELPQNSAYAIGMSQILKAPLFLVEQDMLEYTHAQVAGLLLEKWNYPNWLTQMIRYHHDPFHSKNKLGASIVMVADIMATALRFGCNGNRFVPAFEKEVWDYIGLSPSVLGASIKQVDKQLNEILNVYLPNRTISSS